MSRPINMNRIIKLLKDEFTPSEGANDEYSEGFNAGIRKAIEIAKNQPNTVCCKDCKYGKRLGYLYECDNELHKPDFYCADGELKK